MRSVREAAAVNLEGGVITPLPSFQEDEMAKVTWLGEGEDGPRENVWKGITFKIGEPVETDDLYIYEKASGNRYFKVEGDPPAAEPTPPVHPAPSAVSAQGPVPKAGEPLVPKSGPKKGL